jgi:ribosome-binding ATPase
MLQIAVTGKPNVGKSSFFNSATLSDAEVASYPFTTISANKAIAHVIEKCPCKELEILCSPKNSKCVDGNRMIPIELIDVAGLVPGAHEGRGLGNKFLDDLRQSKAFIHIIDASGSTDEEGRPCEPGTHDPLGDVKFLEHEITMWLFDILKKNWNRLIRKSLSEKLDFSKVLAEQLSGIGIKLESILDAKKTVKSEYHEWKNSDIIEFLGVLLKIAKPMLIVANKADISGAEENIQRLKDEYGNVIPASAEAEIALIKASEAGLIKYIPGDSDFEILKSDELNDNQINALNFIKHNVLNKYGSTGVQEALNKMVFDILGMIVIFPVEDEHKLCDKDGNILPDAILIKKGSKPRDLAYVIHTDIGDRFMHAMDARKGIRISSDHELKDSDIINIICR